MVMSLHLCLLHPLSWQHRQCVLVLLLFWDPCRFVPNMIFPVCNIMVRRRSEYEECLEHFDREVMSLISYTVQSNGQLTVHNETAHLYR